MHLIEVLIAASLLAAVSLTLPVAFTGAVRANRAAGEATWTTVLAAQKVEELRSGPFLPVTLIEASDLLGEAGEPLAGSAATPAFRRVWRTEPLASAPDAVVITVLVAPYRRAALNGPDEWTPGATRLVTLRTRKAP